MSTSLLWIPLMFLVCAFLRDLHIANCPWNAFLSDRMSPPLPSSDCVMSRAECLLTPSQHGNVDHNVDHNVDNNVDHGVYSSVDHSVDNEEDGGSRGRLERKRQSWRRHKFSSLDRAGWDQAKQTISKGNDGPNIIIHSFLIASFILFTQHYQILPYK